MSAPALATGPVPLAWWDVAAVAALEAQLFAEDSPWTAEMFWAELAEGHRYRVLHAPDPDGTPRVVGYAGGSVSGPDDDRGEAEVRTIGVDPGHRRRGLGALLLDDLLSAAGRRRVLLEVRVDNTAARTLYASRGFVPLGVRRGYYQPSGADALVMERPGTAGGEPPRDRTDR